MKCLIISWMPVITWEFRGSPSSQHTKKLPAIRMFEQLAEKRSAMINWVNWCRVCGLKGWAAKSRSASGSPSQNGYVILQCIFSQSRHSPFSLCSTVCLELVYFVFLHLVPIHVYPTGHQVPDLYHCHICTVSSIHLCLKAFLSF